MLSRRHPRLLEPHTPGSRRPLPSHPRNPPLHSSPLFSCDSALFAHNGRSQLLSHQSLPHSFPCNGGGTSLRFSNFDFRVSDPQSPPVSFVCFQQLTTVPIRNLFVFKSLQQWG